ncbi:MAG: alpha/beta hydrolase [Oscillospiraceae bacterium]|nr:alpha/beta hydrolase [Oscillospiraceae bacterium]
MRRSVPLEPAATAVCDANCTPPLIFQLPPEKGRALLEQAQDTPVYKYPAEISAMTVSTGIWGEVTLYMVVPENLSGNANVIYYIHGAGWVFGSFHTHEKLVRELAARTNSILLFPEYSRAPEAQYPVAIEQCYSILAALPGFVQNLPYAADIGTLTVVGDSVGGNMATVLTIMAKERGGPAIHKQVMFYPVTNACFNTGSYAQFASGYYLYRAGMEWFWRQYTDSDTDRSQITASPLRASIEDLAGLPQALIINGEADVLRDEGEAYARKLRKAGVEVTAARFQAIIHDFVMLNALDQTNACRGAMDLATTWINRRNMGKH